MKLNKLVKILAGAVFLSILYTQVHAEDAKADPSGTYVWTVPGRNGGPDRTNTLMLKLDGDKLTGKVLSPGRGSAEPVPVEIKDAKLVGSNVTFSVTREFNGNSFTNKYDGKIVDGAIKGKMEFNRNGETQSRDWDAKKQDVKK